MRIADKSSDALQLALWNSSPASAEPRVRISARARRVSVRVHDDASVELVIPRGVSERRARAFLATRADWVALQVDRRRQVAHPPAAFPPDTVHLSALDEIWRLHQVGGTGAPRILERAGGLLSLAGEGSAAQWRACLRRWLTARARAAFEPRLRALAQENGFAYSRLSIRSQRTRWGSCSTRGTISINLALLFQSPEVLRYLMCHELAHTRHMNHSTAFWQTVAVCEPAWQSLDRELTRGWNRVPRWVAMPRAGES